MCATSENADRSAAATAAGLWRRSFLLDGCIWAALLGLAWSWGTWPDLLVDFGRELYVPWRITAGEVLYRELAYFHGPLSPYFNALLFTVFGVSLRTLLLAFLAVALATHLQQSQWHFNQKRYAVGSGADQFYANVQGLFLAKTIGALQTGIQARTTLVALPEGIMLNYLMRIPNPTPYVLFIPLEMQMFGEEQILAAFQAHPPEWVVFIHRDDSEYGPRFFGRNYGQTILRWLQYRYQPCARIGNMPFNDEGHFGVLIVRRDPQAATE
jgi:hypothetical protein